MDIISLYFHYSTPFLMNCGPQEISFCSIHLFFATPHKSNIPLASWVAGVLIRNSVGIDVLFLCGAVSYSSRPLSFSDSSLSLLPWSFFSDEEHTVLTMLSLRGEIDFRGRKINIKEDVLIG
jgi:hypothetical protein